MNHIIFPGKVLPQVLKIFYGANLTALSKEDGRVRPIAVGFTLRRLAAKTIMYSNKDFCTKHFSPNQLGCGTPKGAKTTVHALRKYLQDPSSTGKVLLKIDFKNAFNTIQRDVILNLVKTKLPKIYNFAHQCYAQESFLRFGYEVLNSSEGVQQGDPLGPFLFSLGIQDLVNNMESPLNCWYLDDGTPGGDANTVLKDLLKIKKVYYSHGLELNTSKCELFQVKSAYDDGATNSFFSNTWSFPNSSNTLFDSNIWSSSSASDMSSTFKCFNDLCNGIRILNKSELTLLGAPIFPEAVEPNLKPKIENLRLMASRLKMIELSFLHVLKYQN